MRDTTTTTIVYDFTDSHSWRSRVVTTGPCPGKDPPGIGPHKWLHERIACDSGNPGDPAVRVLCTCGWRGPPHATESEAIDAFNKSLGMQTIPITDWVVNRFTHYAGDLPF